MSTVFEVADRFMQFDLMRECMAVINDTQAEIIEANREQLQRGKLRNNKYTPAYKSKIYPQEKTNPFQRTNWDLKDTGAFYEGMFVDVGGDEFEISSFDDKTETLQGKIRYGDIFGLSDQIGLPKYIEKTFAPELYKRIEQKTGIEMK